MRTARLRGGLASFFSRSSSVHILPLTGCNDESRTSGTMVQVSEEAKAHLKAKRESYKGGSPKS